MTVPGRPTRRTPRALHAILAAAALTAWAVPPVWAQVATAPAAADTAPLDPDTDNEKSIADAVAVLTNGKSQNERDEAARRLISRQSQKGRLPVHRALADATNRDAQLAAARAVADDPVPQPQLIGPLSDLLGVNDNLTRAAAGALMNYRDENAIRRWSDFVLDRNVTGVKPGRVPAVQAARGAADRSVMLTLIELLRDRDESIRDAAADALNEMTGQTTRNGRDATLWQQFIAGRSADAVRTDLLERQRRRRATTAVTDLDAVLLQMIKVSPENVRADQLKRVLASPDPAIRASGLRVYYLWITQQNGGFIFDKANLREFVRDSAMDVRQEAVRVLARLNDQASSSVMVAQLLVDPEPAVRAEICAALARLQDLRTVPRLLSLLPQGANDDPSPAVAAAAVRAIAAMGPRIAADPRLRDSVVAVLQKAIPSPRAKADASGELLASYLEALGMLGDVSQSRLIADHLANANARVRRAAVTGLGALGDPQSDNAVLNVLRRDSDAEVRLAAVTSLEKLASFSGFAGELYQYTQPGPNGEPDERVRQRAWQAFLTLARKGPVNLVAQWAENIAPQKNSTVEAQDRHIQLLTVRLSLHQDPRNLDLKAAATTREAIGEAMMNHTPPQPASAAPMFESALKYWQANNGTEPTIVGLSRSLVRARLAAGDYREAVLATQAATATPAALPLLQGDLVNEAERLLQANKRDEARALSDLALKTVDSLNGPQRARLEGVRKSAATP